MSRDKREDQRVEDQKRIKKFLVVSLATFEETRAHQEKLYGIQGDAEEERRQRF